MKYYFAQDADEVADELWAEYEAPSNNKSRRRQQRLKPRERGNPKR